MDPFHTDGILRGHPLHDHVLAKHFPVEAKIVNHLYVQNQAFCLELSFVLTFLIQRNFCFRPHPYSGGYWRSRGCLRYTSESTKFGSILPTQRLPEQQNCQ